MGNGTKNVTPTPNANNQNVETTINKNDADRTSRINSSSNPRNVPDTGKGVDSTETHPEIVGDPHKQVGFETNGEVPDTRADRKDARGDARKNTSTDGRTRLVTGNKNDENGGLVDMPEYATPQTADLPVASRNKASGFPVEDRGLIHASEDSSLRKISYDEATNLQTAIAHVTGYQVGSTYRHDFESGLETLRTFGLTYNVDRADSEAMRKQEEFQKDEATQTADTGAAND